MNKVTDITKIKAQKTAQSITKLMRDEGFELVRTARQQIIPQEVAQSYLAREPIQNLADNYAKNGYSKDAHEKETQEKLFALRNRLKQIILEEEAKAWQAESQKYASWKKAQEEKMQSSSEAPRTLEVPQGKRRRVVLGGVAAFLSRKFSKVEREKKGG